MSYLIRNYEVAVVVTYIVEADVVRVYSVNTTLLKDYKNIGYDLTKLLYDIADKPEGVLQSLCRDFPCDGYYQVLGQAILCIDHTDVEPETTLVSKSLRMAISPLSIPL